MQVAKLVVISRETQTRDDFAIETKVPKKATKVSTMHSYEQSNSKLGGEENMSNKREVKDVFFWRTG